MTSPLCLVADARQQGSNDGVIRQQGGEARFVTATGGTVTQAMAS